MAIRNTSVFWIWFFIHLAFQSATSFNNDSSNSVSEVSLSDIVGSQTNDEVLCVLFMGDHKDSHSAITFFMNLKQHIGEHWNAQYRKFISKKNESSAYIPSQVPSIQFFSYWSDNHVFAGPWKQKTLKTLIKKLLDTHKSRIPVFTEEKYLYEEEVSEALVLIVFIQDGTIQRVSHKGIQKLRDEFDSVGFFIHHIHGNRNEETGSLPERFHIRESPTAVLFDAEEKKIITTVEGPFKFLQKIEEMLIIQTSIGLDIITEEIFHSWLQSTDTSSMYLMCFHAVWADYNLAFLRRFSSSVTILSGLQKNLKFGVIDVEKEREILSKHIHPKLIKKIPCCILMWKAETLKGVSVYQELLEARPTPWAISDFLHSLDLNMLDYEENHVRYIPWETEDDCQSFLGITMLQPHCFGVSNQSFVTWEDENNIYQHPTIISHDEDGGAGLVGQTNLLFPDGDEENMGENVRTELRIGNLRQLTDDSWYQVVEQSHVYPRDTSMQYPGEAPWDDNRPKTLLVAFIQESCRSCENNMPLFHILSTNLKNMGIGDFYIHNCSTDKISCEHENVRGFPTLIAFRNFGKQRTERCRSENLMKQYLRMDFHGILTEKLVMEWYLQISTPTVQYATTEDIIRVKEINDVSLHATLYPLSLAGKYLPTISGPNSWYPYECFQLACDRLYGKAVCYGVISENLQSRDSKVIRREQEMVVTQIEMYRRDNLSAVVFSLGKALITTLQNEDNRQLHRFHIPHRYDLKSGQRCEDNHPACTDVIVSFVKDHARLPVTHITAAAFHTHGSIGFGKYHSSSIFTAGLPVVLALATSEQLNANATFSKLLEDTAYQFYDQVVFASLNADEFPQWAARFVPYGYSRHVVENDKFITEDMVPDLFIYPRLCIVTAGNHQGAVFLPKYVEFILGSRAKGRSFSKSNIEEFISDYLSSPDDQLLQTELF